MSRRIWAQTSPLYRVLANQFTPLEQVHRERFEPTRGPLRALWPVFRGTANFSILRRAERMGRDIISAMRLRHRLPIAAGLLALAALATGGCSRRTAAPLAPEGFGDPADLQMRAELSGTELSPGGTVGIDVTVSNPTSRRIRMGFTSGCILVFAVKDATGEVVGPRPYVCTANVPEVEFAAHSSITRHFDWDGASLAYPAKLAPGGYFIVGELGPGGRPSSPVAIEVLSR